MGPNIEKNIQRTIAVNGEKLQPTITHIIFTNNVSGSESQMYCHSFWDISMLQNVGLVLSFSCHAGAIIVPHDHLTLCSKSVFTEEATFIQAHGLWGWVWLNDVTDFILKKSTAIHFAFWKKMQEVHLAAEMFLSNFCLL